MDIPTSIGWILLWAVVKEFLRFLCGVLFIFFGFTCLVVVITFVVAKCLVFLGLAAPEFTVTAQQVFIDTLFPVFLKTALATLFSFIGYFVFKEE